MKKIKFYLLYAATVITIFCCKRDRYQEPDTAQLLIMKPWKLISYGYDHNKDGIISSDEESIRDCERDNVSVYNRDGTGVVLDNAIICDGGEKVRQFNWSLADNDSILDFNFGAAFISRISGENLVITDTSVVQPRLVVSYGH